MSREVLDSRSSYDEVYDDRPERAPRRRSPLRIRIPRSWLTKLRSIAPLAIAFVVGLVIGGAGWNEWQAQRAVAAARSAGLVYSGAIECRRGEHWHRGVRQAHK